METMNIVSFDVDISEYKLLGTKLKQIVNVLKLLKMFLLLWFLKQLKEQFNSFNPCILKIIFKIHGLKQSNIKIYDD